MYKFTCTQEIYNTLSGLAYRIADNQYMIERYGTEGSAIERAQNNLTILDLFDDLDKKSVPFWVQNTVICWAENWRRYKENYVISAFDRYKNDNNFSLDFTQVHCI